MTSAVKTAMSYTNYVFVTAKKSKQQTQQAVNTTVATVA